MPNYHGIEVSSELLESYGMKDLDFKAQARQILCDRLGFEPPIELSVHAELCLRNALKRYWERRLSQEKLDNIIQFQTHVVNTVLLQYAQTGTA
jgi:hypothetical protein